MKIQSVNYIKWIKISISVPLAMLAADLLGLEYVASAGVIALLTIQDTKRETLSVALKRVVAFALMTLLCWGIFEGLGYHIASFGVFLCIFLFLCIKFGLNDAIAMNAVLAGHYLAAGDMSSQVVGNEAAIFALGAGIGLLANLFMPENIKKIRADQYRIDEAMKDILKEMSVYLCREDKTDYTGECFAQVDRLLLSMEKEAKLRIRNTFTKGDTYFASYMEMRMKQCQILKGIYDSIKYLTSVPTQALALSRFLNQVGESFHEKNNVVQLKADLGKLQNSYKLSELPKTREEFENRAVLLQIIRDLGQFLRLKKEFIDNLTIQESEKYWN